MMMIMMNFLFTNFCVLYIALFLFYFAVCARVFVPMAAHLCHSLLLLDREILMKKKKRKCRFEKRHASFKIHRFLFLLLCAFVVFSYFGRFVFKIDSTLAIFAVVAFRVTGLVW